MFLINVIIKSVDSNNILKECSEQPKTIGNINISKGSDGIYKIFRIKDAYNKDLNENPPFLEFKFNEQKTLTNKKQ